ncbi:MAG: M4 family metallopeptidase, partial [Bacteroidota bacterium]
TISKVETKFYGEQTITVDSVAPNEFYLRDPSRNNNTTSHFDGFIFQDDDNTWDLDKEAEDDVALDAHWCTEKFYDYLLNTFNWDGLGNNKEPMNAIVKLGPTVNAYWNGLAAHFFDGGCHHFPLTTLEVVAHEFTHGLTDYTSDLIYSDESGAINESMSDVFGKAVEYYTMPEDFDWDLGHSFLETPYPESFRSFTNPNERGHPKFYKGDLWVDGAGVHTNSSVGNHWFYNLIEGGNGVSESGEPYNVIPLGWEKAMDLVFRIQSAYLMPSSNYNDYYNFSLLAAEEVFGAGASEIDQIKEAWKVVGLPNEQGGGSGNDLAIEVTPGFTTTCIDNEFFPVKVIISNLGEETYMGGAFFELNHEGTYSENIEEEILPGESVEYNVDEFIFFDEVEAAFVDARLEFNDDNTFNNSDFAFISNLISESPDLSFSFFSFSPYNCIDNKREVEFNIENVSCNAVPSGTTFKIILENAGTGSVEEFEYTLDAELGSDRRRLFTETLEPNGIGEFTVRLEYADDSNMDNNTNIGFLTIPEVITTEYLNEFDLFDPYIIPGNGFNAGMKNDGQNAVYAFTGRTTITRRISCPEAQENFSDAPREVQDFSVCVDLSDFKKSNLSFDS